jgi:nitroreductase
MMENDTDIDFSLRNPLDGVAELFSKRWSPRAYGPAPVTGEQLQKVLDAARWSPSCFNEQPWLFITSTPETHAGFVELLVEANQVWAKNAPVLGFIFAKRFFSHNGEENHHAAFDAGSAWMAMTLQARLLGLYTHGMAGIQYEEVYNTFGLDADQYQAICAFSLGALGSADALPDGYREMEKPSVRKPLADIWREGI